MLTSIHTFRPMLIITESRSQLDVQVSMKVKLTKCSK